MRAKCLQYGKGNIRVILQGFDEGFLVAGRIATIVPVEYDESRYLLRYRLEKPGVELRQIL